MASVLPYTIEPGEELDANKVQGDLDFLVTEIGGMSETVSKLEDTVTSTVKTLSGNVDSKISTQISTLLGNLYPVGSIYITTAASCPMATLISGSSWTRVTGGYALWTGNGKSGSGTTDYDDYANAKANTTIKAGLPDIKCTMYNEDGIVNNHMASGGSGSESVTWKASSNGNSLYGKSDTVQPPAYVVNVYRRTA